jgi:hypothetical protein
LPSSPEEGWYGTSNRIPDHPKIYFQQLWLQFGQGKIHAGIYTQIAEKSNIKAIIDRCPISFGQFYTDMQAFIAAEGTVP